MPLFKKSAKSEPQIDTENLARFKITKAGIQQMYADDQKVRAAAGKATSGSSTLRSLTADSFTSNYYNLGSLDIVRKYSKEAYDFYPAYQILIDYLANMCLWKYIYTPRKVKDKKSAVNFEEVYQEMSQVVDGISLETTGPQIITNLLINGAVYLYSVKHTSSKTVTTIQLPVKYCRPVGLTQFGTYLYQFNYQYFDSLSLSAEELQVVMSMYPSEMAAGYKLYKENPSLYQWQQLNSKFSGAILLNDDGFPTKLRALLNILHYNEYLENELTKSQQQLDKIISHKIPTWQDQLLMGMEEMASLHKSIADRLSVNKHLKLVTTFGDMGVLPVGKEDTKENKTLSNAYDAIFNNAGENAHLFSGDLKESVEFASKRDQSIVLKYVNQIANYFNLVVNNLFNFKGYQCDIQILPVTIYNYSDMMEMYRQSATLGAGKLEFIVTTGTKQCYIADKIELEDYLRLDKLKPLSTSYTQTETVTETEEVVEEPVVSPEEEKEENTTEVEQEVVTE